MTIIFNPTFSSHVIIPNSVQSRFPNHHSSTCSSLLSLVPASFEWNLPAWLTGDRLFSYNNFTYLHFTIFRQISISLDNIYQHSWCSQNVFFSLKTYRFVFCDSHNVTQKILILQPSKDAVRSRPWILGDYIVAFTCLHIAQKRVWTLNSKVGYILSVEQFSFHYGANTINWLTADAF